MKLLIANGYVVDPAGLTPTQSLSEDGRVLGVLERGQERPGDVEVWTHWPYRRSGFIDLRTHCGGRAPSIGDNCGGAAAPWRLDQRVRDAQHRPGKR